MLELALAVFVLLLASAIFSGTEAALFSLPPNRAQQLAERSANGRVLLRMKQNLSRPIATVVIGNNLANIVGTFYVAQLSTAHLGETAQAWFPYLLTLGVILFSEILPKNLGERYCVPIGLVIARPLRLLTWLVQPVVVVIEWLVGLLIPQPTALNTTDEEEIKLLARIGVGQGVIDESEQRMIHGVFLLDDVKARDLMTPRVTFTKVEANLPLRRAQYEVARSPHSRILVIEGDPDNLIGVVRKNDVLRHLVENGDLDVLVRDLAVPVRIVPPSRTADELLSEFREGRDHIALVGDEHGGVLGLVTLEDVLELLTGQILDETDKHLDLRRHAQEVMERRRRGRREM